VEYGLHHPDPEAPLRQISRLKKIKATRDNVKVEQSLEQLRQAARGSDNLMPHLIAAAETYATLGEIVLALKEVWGKYREPDIAL